MRRTTLSTAAAGTLVRVPRASVTRVRALAWSVLAVLAVLWLGGCSVTVPADPEGTLQAVRGTVLRAGVAHNPPWVTAPAGDGPPGGVEPELVQEFAETLDAEVQWTVAGEEALMNQLERGRLDLVAGGLTARSPWTSHASLTYPYLHTRDATGQEQAHVMAVRMGENAFLLELERFLLGQEVTP